MKNASVFKGPDSYEFSKVDANKAFSMGNRLRAHQHTQGFAKDCNKLNKTIL